MALDIHFYFQEEIRRSVGRLCKYFNYHIYNVVQNLGECTCSYITSICPHGQISDIGLIMEGVLPYEKGYCAYICLYTAISIKVVPRAKRKSLIRARKAAGNR